MAFDRLVSFGAPSEKPRRLILFSNLVGISRWFHQRQITLITAERYLVVLKSLSSNFRLNEYQESNCSYLDFKQSLRLARIFCSRME